MPLSDYVVYLIIIIVIFCFLYFPRKKEERLIKEMQDKLKTGDKIITYSGLSGEIEEIKDDRVTIKTNPDGLKIAVEKWAIAGLDNNNNAK